MPDYKTLYLRLFGAIEDALEHLEKRNIGLAADCLIAAQRETEECIMESDRAEG